MSKYPTAFMEPSGAGDFVDVIGSDGCAIACCLPQEDAELICAAYNAASKLDGYDALAVLERMPEILDSLNRMIQTFEWLAGDCSDNDQAALEIDVCRAANKTMRKARGR